VSVGEEEGSGLPVDPTANHDEDGRYGNPHCVDHANVGNCLATLGSLDEPSDEECDSPCDDEATTLLPMSSRAFEMVSAFEPPVLGEGGWPTLQTAGLGGVAHDVGTLRMAEDGTGVVDADLKFVAYDNLYACDNSVFPTSPTANPSLTTVALALRLAQYLTM
jgi:choline dehydrogenase-like flavoprotein